MTRLDRYLLSQLMALFGFFALVLVAVYWVNLAVRLFDRLIADGQTAVVVFEFTALSLPNVIRLVLPVAAFAASLYVFNRASGDSELVVMRAAGASPARLMRPVAVFGLIVAAMMLVLVHVLVPASRARLAERQVEISDNITARFLREGSFQHPAPGVTIYIARISELGELLDVYLFDAREGASRTTYTARKALIVPSDSGPKLVMFDGMAQVLDTTDRRLSVTRYADFTYDLAALAGPQGAGLTSLDTLGTGALFAPSAAVLAATGKTAADLRRELHLRLAQPWLAPVSALIGAAMLMLGGFSRFGMWRQIAAAVAGLIALQFLSNAAASAMRRAPDAVALAYLPALIGLVAVAVILWLAARPRRIAPPQTQAALGAGGAAR